MTAGELRIGVACFGSVGGSGVVAAELAMAMARRGHRVFVLAEQPPLRLRPDGAYLTFRPVAALDYPLFAQRSYALALAGSMIDLARAERLDLLHVHYAIPHALSALLAMQAMGNAAPKLLTTLHGTDVTVVGRDRLLQPLLRLALGASHALTAPSRWLAQAALAELGSMDGAEIEVVPNFVDLDRFRPSGPADRRPGSRPVLIHVSNFRPVKRTEDVVRVFASVRSRLAVRLVLVGDGPERARTEALVASLGLGADVDFLGEQSDVETLLRRADILLLPSENESFGLAALEAMACGLPVVGTSAGGLPEVVESGETGFLAEPGQVDAMAAHVLRLLGDPAQYQRTAAAARARAEQLFAPAVVVPRYEAIYRRLLGL